jgi:FkbM family methyltransferase
MYHPPNPNLADRFLAYWWRHNLRGAISLSHLLGRPDALVARSKSGAVFRLSLFGYIDGIVLREGDYESEVRVAMNCASDGQTVWDIGSNFGLHAVTLGLARPDLKIVAFEPNPREHARLMVHRDWNAPSVQTCSLALSDQRGLQPLFLGPLGNSGMTTLSPWSKAEYAGTVLVPVARGDELISSNALPPPNVIKLDVEGHESSVLRGLEQTLRSGGCHTVIFEDALESGTEPKQILSAAGFSWKPLLRNESTSHALVNFIARRS